MYQKTNQMTCLYLMCWILLSLSGCTRNGPEVWGETVMQNSLQSTEENVVSAKEETAGLMVFVCGEVVQPGVYSFPEKSRIREAVLAAGGFTEEADETYLNLAAFLEDGQKLEVPSKEEAQSLRDVRNGEGKININRADMTELCTLPGIGESRASEIIAYREKNGDFQATEDLMKVDGIKQGTFEKLKEKITVGK